jgi:tetraacyldisaccharide 4'-kinase
MRAPAFWYQPRGALASMLLPAAMLYQLGAKTHRAITVPYQSPTPIICIGNIVAGGAGKTPTALTILKLLREMGQRPVCVSRGYGGSMLGPLLVDVTHHSSAEVGDEPLLLAQHAPTWIGKNKLQTVRAVTGATQIILDDGLQNPTLAHDLAILVIDGMRGLGNGQVIPAGPLREKLSDALQRAHAVLLIGADRHNVSAMIAGRVPVLTAQLRAVPIPHLQEKNFVAFAGIGYPEKFFAACRDAALKLSDAISFPDHHPFSDQDWQTLKQTAAVHQARLLTTAKDAVRLKPAWRTEVDVLPVELLFDQPTQMIDLLKKLIK